MSDSVRPHRRQPTRLPCPWDSPGKNTGVGCHFLLQCVKVKSESEVTQSCPTLRNPVDCSLPGSSVHGIFQTRALEWDVIEKFLKILMPRSNKSDSLRVRVRIVNPLLILKHCPTSATLVVTESLTLMIFQLPHPPSGSLPGQYMTSVKFLLLK